jgi:hypothetical protein
VWYFGFRNKDGGIGGDRVPESRNYLDLGFGTLCSDDDLEEIESRAECIRALDELKIPMSAQESSTSASPSGCIRLQFNDNITAGVFNDISPGTGNSHGLVSPICRKG